MNDPFRVNGFKYGSTKQAFLAPLLFSAGKGAVSQLTSGSSDDKDEKHEKTQLSSKDPTVEKALANPAVKDYINRLVTD
jgi:hypothetical protein